MLISTKCLGLKNKNEDNMSHSQKKRVEKNDLTLALLSITVSCNEILKTRSDWLLAAPIWALYALHTRNKMIVALSWLKKIYNVFINHEVQPIVILSSYFVRDG